MVLNGYACLSDSAHDGIVCKLVYTKDIPHGASQYWVSGDASGQTAHKLFTIYIWWCDGTTLVIASIAQTGARGAQNSILRAGETSITRTFSLYLVILNRGYQTQ